MFRVPALPPAAEYAVSKYLVLGIPADKNYGLLPWRKHLHDSKFPWAELTRSDSGKETIQGSFGNVRLELPIQFARLATETKWLCGG